MSRALAAVGLPEGIVAETTALVDEADRAGRGLADVEHLARVDSLSERIKAVLDAGPKTDLLLALAWVVRSRLYHGMGALAEAVADADRAVTVLMRHSDDIGRIQPALVLALDAGALAHRAVGSDLDAQRLMDQAASILTQLAEKDAEYTPDLEAHIRLPSTLSDRTVDGDPSVELTRLLDEGYRLIRDGLPDQAAELLQRVLGQTLLLWREPADITGENCGLQRLSAKAYFRYGGALAELGRFAEAARALEQGAYIGFNLLDRLDRSDARYDDITADTANTLVDLGEFYALAGDFNRRFRLLDTAIAICGQARKVSVRRSRATALYNKANAMMYALVECAQQGRPLRFDPREIGRICAESCSIRDGLVDPGNQQSVWECASAHLLRARAAALTRDFVVVAEHLEVALRHVQALGSAGDDLRGSAEAIAHMIEREAPHVAGRVRAARSWPL